MKFKVMAISFQASDTPGQVRVAVTLHSPPIEFLAPFGEITLHLTVPDDDRNPPYEFGKIYEMSLWEVNHAPQVSS